jgi:hypothetical protein
MCDTLSLTRRSSDLHIYETLWVAVREQEKANV